MKIFLKLLLILPLYVIAEQSKDTEPILTEQITIIDIQQNMKSKSYRVNSIEKAASLNSPMKFNKCFQESIQNKKKVEVSFKAFKLDVVSCKVLP